MKKASVILAVVGVVLVFLPVFSGVDVFDEQAFRWRVEHWMWLGGWLCLAAAAIIAALRKRRWYTRLLWALVAVLSIYLVVDVVRSFPRLLYSDESYQFWDNNGYAKLYYGRGTVMDDAGGLSLHPLDCQTIDSCIVERIDSLGVFWVEWREYWKGEFYAHEGTIVPIDPRFASRNYSRHTAQLDSLLAARIHDSVAPGQWYKTRTVLEGAGGQ